jgi:hypothetical protein
MCRSLRKLIGSDLARPGNLTFGRQRRDSGVGDGWTWSAPCAETISVIGKLTAGARATRAAPTASPVLVD